MTRRWLLGTAVQCGATSHLQVLRQRQKEVLREQKAETLKKKAEDLELLK